MGCLEEEGFEEEGEKIIEIGVDDDDELQEYEEVGAFNYCWRNSSIIHMYETF
jgi:hypothetical protein